VTRSTTRTRSAVTTTAELRIPTQERGTRRVEMILDAAAELVTEVGPEGITVQLLAERAETSKGSLYHFFPDVPAVLRALADRHRAAIDVILDSIANDESIDWRNVPTHEVVTHLLAPLDYLEQNCDLLGLVRAPAVLPRSARAMEPMVTFAETILGSRFPDMSEDHLAARSNMIVAVMDGVVGMASRGCAMDRVELERLLEAYVDSIA
jgi:AcrR family transcriptional regulator